MAFNSFFPTGYQPYFQPQNNTSAERIFVQGEAGANTYLIAPNTTAILWDADGKTFYIKSADASGMPTLKVYDYVERKAEETPKVEYATQDELKALRKEIEKLKGGKK